MADRKQSTEELARWAAAEPPGTWIPLPRECCFCFKIGKTCPRTPCKFYHGTDEGLLAARARQDNAYCPATGGTARKDAKDFARSHEPQIIHRHAKSWLEKAAAAENASLQQPPVSLQQPPLPPAFPVIVPYPNDLVGLLPPPMYPSSTASSYQSQVVSRSQSGFSRSSSSWEGSPPSNASYRPTDQPQPIIPDIPLIYTPHQMMHSVAAQQIPPMHPIYTQPMVAQGSQMQTAQPRIIEQTSQHLPAPQLMANPPIMYPSPMFMAGGPQSQPMNIGGPNYFQSMPIQQNQFLGPHSQMQVIPVSPNLMSPNQFQGPMQTNQFQGQPMMSLQPNQMVPQMFYPGQF